MKGRVSDPSLYGVTPTDNDFWFPLDLPPLGSVPQCSWGHTATYDLDTKRIYVFGGMKEGKHYSTIYILDTATWKWLLVAVSSGTSMGKQQSMWKEVCFCRGPAGNPRALPQGP